MDGVTEADHALETAAIGQSVQHAALDRAERASLVWRMLQVHARKDPLAVTVACDDALSILRDKLPEPVFAGSSPYFTSQRAECTAWAEFASDGQIAAMLVACLDRIVGARVLAADRKRLFVALWNGLPPDDRKAFLDKVAAPKPGR